VNGLSDDYSGKLTIVLNDHEYLITLRNIILLQILGTVSDIRLAADIALHFWYSAFMPRDYHFLVDSLALQIVEQGDVFESKLGGRTTLIADTDSNLREL
jgi:hypothetical protein